ncbi:MAG TPA: glycosyltransferase [Candidatus Saccharimonadales bacterium]|nr:glycosyltransferase [Candidatus Saccharimonadales bacterium]
MKKAVSVIIPARNEEGTIVQLIRRIDSALTSENITYEIIIIDDHSTDKTFSSAKKFSKNYPVFVHKKKGMTGKAQSLIEGFSYAKYDLLCMIDADLQYPPESIPEMIEKILHGSDIVVANRNERETSALRQFLSKGYLYFFGKVLHGFTCDVQSGMKVFKKEIIERVTLNPTPWTFDLEFLLKARNAGYSISTINIIFAERISGQTKIKLVNAISQIGWTALRYKFVTPEIVPFHPTVEKKKGKGFHHRGQEYVHHSKLDVDQTAFYRLTRTHKIILIEIALILSLAFFLNWHETILVTIAVLTGLYFFDLLYNLYLVYRSFSTPSELIISNEEIAQYKGNNWPTYTVFCPLYKEAHVVPQFVTAMSRLDYPKNKLQVMLLLEEDDKETIKNIRKQALPSYFEIVVVPDSQPKTKPKACNFGLTKATGEYSVIYDAEDVPDPLQLKKTVLAFKKGGDKIMCIQAKLNFYNPNQNLLSRMFTAEYSLWFDLVLTGLQSINAPIPLGGTSNHFRTADLIKLKGWDSFNVTEDCDLGMRLVKAGYRTAVVDSITLEEANSSYKNWIKQRSRWIKGYMQTYLVHCRDLGGFNKRKRDLHLFSFQLIVGGKVLSMFINPLMWMTTIAYFLFRAHIGTFIESFFPAWVLYMGVVSLIFGNFLYLYYYMIGTAKHGHHELVKYVFLVPIYWLAMSVAAWYAAYKLITAPHHWAKTKHGLHISNKKAIEHATQVIGQELIDDNFAAPLSPAI